MTHFTVVHDQLIDGIQKLISLANGHQLDLALIHVSKNVKIHRYILNPIPKFVLILSEEQSPGCIIVVKFI